MMVHLDNMDEKGYEVPGDRDAIDWATVGLVVFALVLLWLVIALWVPGPV